MGQVPLTKVFLRLPVMNQFVLKLDSRYEKTKKPGTGSTVKRERSQGLPSTSSPPSSLPSWMIDPSYNITPATSVASICIRESSLDPNHDSSNGKWFSTLTTLYLFYIVCLYRGHDYLHYSHHRSAVCSGRLQ